MQQQSGIDLLQAAFKKQKNTSELENSINSLWAIQEQILKTQEQQQKDSHDLKTQMLEMISA